MNPEGKPPRVVIDTNVLFSAAALAKTTPPAQIVELARLGKIEACISYFILDELEKNLAKKAGWDQERLGAFRKKLRGFMTLIEPTSRLDVIKSVDADNRILECSVDAKAAVLITGNMKDIRPLGDFQGIAIVTPREFLDRYFPNS